MGAFEKNKYKRQPTNARQFIRGSRPRGALFQARPGSRELPLSSLNF